MAGAFLPKFELDIATASLNLVRLPIPSGAGQTISFLSLDCQQNRCMSFDRISGAEFSKQTFGGLRFYRNTIDRHLEDVR